MGITQQMISRAPRRSNYFENLRRARMEREQKKQELLTDPSKLDKVVSDHARFASLSTKKPPTDVIDKTTAVDKLNRGNPMEGFGEEFRMSLLTDLQNPEFKKLSKEEIIGRRFNELLQRPDAEGVSRLERSNRYKREADTSLFEIVGFDTDDPDVKKPVGYDQWLEATKAIEKGERSKISYFASPGQIAAETAIGAGLGAAFGGLPGAVSFGALAAAVAVPGHALRRALKNTEWYNANMGSDSLLDKAQVLGLEIAPDIAMGVGIEKAAGKVLFTAVEAGRISKELTNKLSFFPKAKEIIKAGKAQRTERITKEAWDKIKSTPGSKGIMYDRHLGIDSYAETEALQGLTEIQNFSITQELLRSIPTNPKQAKEFAKRVTPKEPIAPRDIISRELAKSTSDDWYRSDPKQFKSLFTNATEEETERILRDADVVGIHKSMKKFEQEKLIEKEITKREDIDFAYRFEQLSAEQKKIIINLKNKEYLVGKGYASNLVDKMLKSRANTLANKLRKKEGLPPITAAEKVMMTLRNREYLIGKDITDDFIDSANAARLNRITDKASKEEFLLKKIPKPKVSESIQVTTSKIDISAKRVKIEEGTLLKNMEEGVEEIPAVVSGSDVGKIIEEELSPFELFKQAAFEVKEETFLKSLKREADIANKRDIKGAKVTKEGRARDSLDVFKSIVLGATLVPLASLLSPDEAEAGTLSSVGKLLVPKMFKAAVEGSGKAKDKLIKEFVENDAILREIDPANPFTLPKEMRVMSTAKAVTDAGVKLNDAVKATKSIFGGMAKFMSPFTQEQIYYKSGMGPVPELAMMQGVITGNVMNGQTVLKNILNEVPGSLDGKVTRAISAEMEGLAEKYSGSVTALSAVDKHIGQLEKRIESIKKLERKLGKGKRRIISIDTLEGQLENLKESRKKLMPEFEKFNTEYESKIKILAGRYSSTRISLAAEDTEDFINYPWLKEVITSEEKLAVKRLKVFNEEYGRRLLEVGQEIKTDRPFMHHAFHPKWIKENAEKVLESTGINAPDSVPFAKFHRRTKYSKQMIPDVGYNMSKYIPDIEHRIQVTKFWDKGNKTTSWHAHKNSAVIRSNPELKNFWDGIEEGMKPFEDTATNRLANRYSAFEVMRFLFMNPSSAFKHLFKLTGTYATFGAKESLSHVKESFEVTVRNWRNDPAAGMLIRKLGINPGTEKHFIDDTVKSFTLQSRHLGYLADMDVREMVSNRGAFESWFDKSLEYINKKGSIPMQMIESFDRTHTVLAATEMAARKGMTGVQASNAIYSAILKNNFLGGNLSPRWLRNPKVRALMLFQATPFKILERRLLHGRAFGKSVKGAWGVIKEQDVNKTLKDLYDLRSYIWKAEGSMKGNLIRDALNQEADVFGTSLSQQFMREILYTGAVIGGGSMVGVNFKPHSVHLPFVTMEDTAELHLSPIFQSTARTIQEPFGKDHDMFPVNTFLQDYLKSTGPMPTVVKKALRISERDIPKIYKDSPLMYIFGVPAKGMGH